MSFEHKYLKYKQKYLDLKKEVSLLKIQLGGASQDVSAVVPPAAVDESSLDISALTDTPKVSEQAKQLGGYLMSTESDSEQPKFLNSESEDNSLDNVDNLTETPQKHDMVVSINSSEESEPSMAEEMLASSDEEQEDEDDSSDKKEEISDEDSSDNEDQEGGDLETSISELEEIFSQLGGKKAKSKKEDSDSDFGSSSMSSLSSLDSSSSEFDL